MEDEDLAAWFPTRVEGERTKGAKLRFVFPDDQPGGEGEITVWEPPSVLEFRWEADTFRFEVSPTPGGCTLAMSQVFDELGKAARDGAGWSVCLDELAFHLDGQRAPSPARQRWERAHTALIDRYGPETATVGVPEGHRWEDEGSTRRLLASARRRTRNRHRRRTGGTVMADHDVVWPRAPRTTPVGKLAPRPASLSGRKVAFLWDYLFRGDEIFPLLEEELAKAHPA